MADDDVMDVWLQEAMADDQPRLSAAFDDKVMARVRRRPLTASRRAVLGVYALGALGLSSWAMQGIDVAWVAASMLGGTLMCAAMSRYVGALVITDR